jgi:hypothetical protein
LRRKNVLLRFVSAEVVEARLHQNIHARRLLAETGRVRGGQL